MNFETAFTMEASSLKFGSGVTREIGEDLKRFNVKRVLVFVDPNLVTSQVVETVLESIKKQNIDTAIFNEIRIEPTDASFKAAINIATEGKFDGFVAVGGGSTIDTAKAANLYATRVRQRPHRQRNTCAWTPQTARRRSHYRRHGQRNDGRGDF
jgi:hydroxyacid-oxoacid transhydrogenase